MESNPDPDSRLVASVQETIDSLRKFSMNSSPGKDTRSNFRSPKTATDDCSNLEDDEVDLKVPPPAARENQQVWSTKRKSLVPSLISNDMDQIHALDQVEKSLHRNEKEVFDSEHASLMGAVLGIGERKKENPQPSTAKTSISPSNSEKIGTMAGFGEITDQDADLSDELVQDRESNNNSDSKRTSTEADTRRQENIERCLSDASEDKKSATEDQIMRTEDELQKMRKRMGSEEIKSGETNDDKKNSSEKNSSEKNASEKNSSEKNSSEKNSSEKKSSTGILKKLSSFMSRDKS